jgi:hypothetical protein
VEAEAAYFPVLPLPPKYFRFRGFRFHFLFHITAEVSLYTEYNKSQNKFALPGTNPLL